MMTYFKKQSIKYYMVKGCCENKIEIEGKKIRWIDFMVEIIFLVCLVLIVEEVNTRIKDFIKITLF